MTYVPQPGDIGLTVITGWGRLIRLGQWLNGDGFADYEHAFVITEYRAGEPKPWIVEAMPGGAQHVRLWHPADRTVYLRCPERYREAVAASARGLVGVPYSVADYFALAAARLHIPAPHLKKFVRDSHRLICSQLADTAAAEGGWHLFDDDRWPGDVTPGDLYALYRKQETK